MARQSGVFLVLSVDADKQTVELMPLDHMAPLLDAVPFSDLQTYAPTMPLEMI